MFGDLSFLMNNTTPWGIVGLFTLAMMTGRVIVPKFYYKELLADRDRWRTVAESQTSSVAVFADAMPGLLEIGKTTDKVMSAIQEKNAETAQ